MKRNIINTAKIVAAGLCLTAGQAFATNLLPGGTILNPGALPAGSTPSGPSTAVSSTAAQNPLIEGSSWKVGSTTGASVTFANGVWVDPTGGLDFFYQIQNTTTAKPSASNTVASSYSLVDFTGIPISNVFQVNYATAGATGCAFFGAGPCPPDKNGSGFLRPTTETITSVSRSLDGSTLNVNLSAGVTPKTNSAILVVETGSTDFDQTGEGTFSWHGAPPVGARGSGPGQNTIGPWQLDALEPLLTPEPGFYGILALGIAGLLLFVRRRSGKAEAKAPASV